MDLNKRFFGRERGLRGSSFEDRQRSFDNRFKWMFRFIIGGMILVAIFFVLTFFGIITPSKEFMEMMRHHDYHHGRSFMDDDDDF